MTRRRTEIARGSVAVRIASPRVVEFRFKAKIYRIQRTIMFLEVLMCGKQTTHAPRIIIRPRNSAIVKKNFQVPFPNRCAFLRVLV
jgi:hypothetical protein